MTLENENPPHWQGVKKEAFCRMDMKKPKSTLVFHPDALSDSQAASSVVKRSVFGAVFLGHTGKLHGEYSDIVWETELQLGVSPALRAVRPRYFLMGSVALKAEHVYKLL